MLLSDYKQRKEDLRVRFDKLKYNLDVEFAESCNPYKVGDIIVDHIGKARILKWEMRLNSSTQIPELRYWCDNLTQKGTINKREPERWVYQCNIK